ncbi:hypothetical protein TNCV_783791 [Trichonephila clavipes]|nr:hypothetical protein TNCV_783791 [Trichonephila clavipes]
MSKYPLSPTSRPGTPELLSPCEKLKLVAKTSKKYLLLAQGTEQSLKLLAPHMKADEPEVIDLFRQIELPTRSSTKMRNVTTNPNKRKENDDDGFVSPSRRQTIKKPN